MKGFVGLAPCPPEMSRYSFLDQIRNNKNLSKAYGDKEFQIEWQVYREYNDRHILSGNLLINEPISEKENGKGHLLPLNDEKIDMT